jgi:glycosyltransferase involved in cell wall biosynthesis
MNDQFNQANKPALVSLVCPFFNEELSITLFYGAITAVINANPQCDFEVICVDDGSSDSTLELLVRLTQNDSRFRVIELSRNFGKEAALTAGIDMAQGDAVIPIDADLQDPPELIPQMIAAWQNGADVVLAKRVNRDSDSYLKKQSAKLFYQFFNRLSPVQIPENVGDFRLMNRQSIDAVKALPEHQRFMKGLFSWVGFKTVTLEYTRAPRLTGSTKFSGWKLWNFALDGITSFSTIPLKIWTYLGLIGALLSILYGFFIIYRTLIYGIEVPGYSSILVAILFFGSLQLISLGVLGEYLGRIYLESKQRPLYFIRRVHEKQD